MFKYLKKVRPLLFNKKNAIEEKNTNIFININKFINEFNGDIVPREVNIKPEILIPCFNQGKYLRDALDSIYKNDINVTIINDASTDNTSEYIQELESEYKFKLINNTINLNQAGSLNKAIQNSNNNLFIILNADDCLLSYSLNTIMSIFEYDHSISMVGGGSIWFKDDRTIRLNKDLPDKLSYEPHYKMFGPEQAKLFTHQNDINMTMSSCSFLKSAWQTVGGFKEFKSRVCSFDDRDFQMRVCSFFNVAIIDEPLALYRINSSVCKGQI